MECAQEMKRSIFSSTKLILCFLIVIYVGASLITCGEYIPLCKESLRALKADLKDWQKRCLNDQLYDLNIPCCDAEKEYIQNRRKMLRKLCFYKGNHFIRY